MLIIIFIIIIIIFIIIIISVETAICLLYVNKMSFLPQFNFYCQPNILVKVVVFAHRFYDIIMIR